MGRGLSEARRLPRFPLTLATGTWPHASGIPDILVLMRPKGGATRWTLHGRAVHSLLLSPRLQGKEGGLRAVPAAAEAGRAAVKVQRAPAVCLTPSPQHVLCTQSPSLKE